MFAQASQSILALVDEEELPDNMIVDAGSDQSVEDNGERAVYISENIIVEVEQPTGDYGERDVSITQ